MAIPTLYILRTMHLNSPNFSSQFKFYSIRRPDYQRCHEDVPIFCNWSVWITNAFEIARTQISVIGYAYLFSCANSG